MPAVGNDAIRTSEMREEVRGVAVSGVQNGMALNGAARGVYLEAPGERGFDTVFGAIGDAGDGGDRCVRV